MKDLPDIRLKLFSRADMGAAGDEVLAALADDSALAPQRFGPFEPYKIAFPSEEVSLLWRREAATGTMIGGERKRPFSVIVTVSFGFHPGDPFHSLAWFADVRVLDLTNASARLEALFRRLALGMRAFYGFAAHDDEFARQNVKPTSSGSFRVLGNIPHNAIPGLYWLNYFGPEYTQLIGADRLRAVDPPVEPLGEGTLLKLAASPLDMLAPAAIERTESIKRQLGAELFFDIAHPDRPTRAPFVPIPKPRDLPPPPGLEIDIDLPGMPDAAQFIVTARARAADWRRRNGLPVPGNPTFKEARVVLRKIESELDPGLPEIHPETVVADTTAVLGEMIIARLGGQWRLHGDPDPDGTAHLRVVTGRGEIVDPMQRILKRTGDPDAQLYRWYHALVTETLPPPLVPERDDAFRRG